MSYLRKKLQAIMACADFKGYLREVTGAPPLTLTDCMGSDLVSLSVTGNAAQGGTPSPDAPVEVQGVGEKTGNLFDVTNLNLCMTSTSSIDYTPKVENGIFYSGGQSGKASGQFPYVEIGDAETVTISFTVSGETPSGYIYGFDGVDDDGVVIGNVIINNFSNSLGTITFTYTGAKQYIGICVFSQNRYGVALSNIQIIKGSYAADTMPPFEPYGYKVPVKVGGINLFGISGRTELHSTSASPPTMPKSFKHNIIVGLASNGYWDSTRIASYSFDGDSFTLQSSAGYGLGFDFDIKAGETYTVSYAATESRTGYASWYDADGLYMSRTAIRGAFASVTAPNGATKMVLCFDSSSVAITISDMQVLKGSYTVDTMPPFEAYHEPQTFNVYMDKPLYAVGDVGDMITLDFDAKTATRTENVGSFTFNGSETWNLNPSDAAYNGDKTTCRYNATTGLNGTYISISGFCDRLPYKTGAIWGMNIAEECFVFNSNQVHMRLSNDLLGITSDDDSATRTAKFKAWLSANATTVFGKRATPTTTDISALQDWDAMPSTWRGTVTISADTTIQPSSMTAKYYATKKED